MSIVTQHLFNIVNQPGQCSCKAPAYNTGGPGYHSRGRVIPKTLNVIVMASFFLSLLLWVFLVCIACYALLHVRGHSHSPPLNRHYVSCLISTFAKTTAGLMAPTGECMHLTNRVTSQCELVTIFFQSCEASRHIFSDSVMEASHKDFVQIEG